MNYFNYNLYKMQLFNFIRELHLFFNKYIEI
nr:MAG TPA: hypothetical protein [Bacteriophage sp.]